MEGSLSLKYPLIESSADNLTIANYNTLDLSPLANSYPKNIDFLKGSKLFNRIHGRLLTINYQRINKIPEEIKRLIIMTEDPDFYLHSGIDIPRIGYALAKNVSERRFKKGASTITMQLTRNLLLGHDKNIFRKFDEAMLSVLMEKHLKIPKKRIFELYLNLIEFGPTVFGIANACSFYFSKDPKELTLTESIVLTYIIPRPIFFYEALISNSEILKRNLKIHFSGILSLMKTDAYFKLIELDKIDNFVWFSEKLGNRYLKVR